MADTKLTALTATTTIDGTELFYVVEDPSGTPLSRKVTGADVKTYMSTGVGGTPGGSDTQVQFNDSAAFGGDAGLTYNKTTDTLTVATKINVPSLATASGAITIAPASGMTIIQWSGANDTVAVSGSGTVALTSNAIGTSLQIVLSAPDIRVGSNVPIRWNSASNLASGSLDTGVARNAAGVMEVNSGTAGTLRDLLARHMILTDGVTAPSATVGQAKIFVDTADGDLKVIFGDGVVKTIIVDS